MAISVQKKKDQINLLPQEGLASTPFGRVLMWVLSSFRIIVIVTEIIVMASFLSRFWLDANNTDLNEELQEKASLVANQEAFENEFRETQNKLAIYTELTNQEGKVSTGLQQIVEGLPPDVFLEQLQFNGDIITISGASPSERSVQQFIVNLENKNAFIDVNLGDLQSDVDNPSLLKFSIRTQT